MMLKNCSMATPVTTVGRMMGIMKMFSTTVLPRNEYRTIAREARTPMTRATRDAKKATTALT